MLDTSRTTNVHPEPAPGERLLFLDALRGLGALGIASYHIYRYRPRNIGIEDILPSFVKDVLLHGWIGVQVFWVIAGFVLAYSLRKTAVTSASFGNFSLRRVVRLGSPYWAAILLVVALDILARQFLHIAPSDSLVDDAPVGWAKLAANLTFLQDVLGFGNISAGTWFVCVDLQVGLLFMAMLGIAQMISRRLTPNAGPADTNTRTLLLVFIPLGLASLFWFNIASYDYSAWAICFFHMPLFGALAWWALEKRIPRIIFWAFAATMVCGIVYRCHLELNYKKPLDVSVALTTGLVIYIVGRRGHLGDWLSARTLQYLGRISYSLFLTHYATSWVVVSLGCYWTGDKPKPAVLWMAAAFFVSIGVADLFYRFVEAPSLRLVKRLKS